MEHFYFGPQSRRLFGALSRPAGNASIGLVFCPPFGLEMSFTYAYFARWAKELSARGVAVLRFHPFGTGDSDGTSGEFTLDGMLNDTLEAVSYLSEVAKPHRVGLFGLRLGAFVAAHAVEASRADFLMLWSPVISMRQYVRELLRQQLAKELVHQQVERVRMTTQNMISELEAGRSLDLIGGEFSAELYRQMDADPQWPGRPSAPHVLWLGRPRERNQAAGIVDSWRQRGVGAEFGLLEESPFWESGAGRFPETFTKASVAWLEKKRAARS